MKAEEVVDAWEQIIGERPVLEAERLRVEVERLTREVERLKAERDASNSACSSLSSVAAHFAGEVWQWQRIARVLLRYVLFVLIAALSALTLVVGSVLALRNRL